MKNNLPRDLSGLWAVTWRSVVYLPLCLATFCLLLGGFVLSVIPLFAGVICLCFGFWEQGITALVIQAAIVWLWRHFRLVRFYAGESAGQK